MITREQWEVLWRWAYPLAVTLSMPRVRAAWISQHPVYLLGCLSKEEAEGTLRDRAEALMQDPRVSLGLHWGGFDGDGGRKGGMGARGACGARIACQVAGWACRTGKLCLATPATAALRLLGPLHTAICISFGIILSCLHIPSLRHGTWRLVVLNRVGLLCMMPCHACWCHLSIVACLLVSSHVVGCLLVQCQILPLILV